MINADSYINASFIKSPFKESGLQNNNPSGLIIASQTPLSNTQETFWKMIV